jgi:hypothetical protein
MFALISSRVPAGHVALAVGGSLGRRDPYGAGQVPSWVHRDGSARSADGLMINVWCGAPFSTAGLSSVASGAGSRRRSRGLASNQATRQHYPLVLEDVLHLLGTRCRGIGLRHRLLNRRQYRRFARELCPITVGDARAVRDPRSPAIIGQ